MKKLLFLTLVSLQVGVFAQVNLNQGLLAYYPFNGNANDATSNGNNGYPLNGVQLTTDRFGNPNSAYYFDGIDDRIVIYDNGTLAPSKFTLACHFNADRIIKQTLIGKIEYGNGNGATYNMGIYDAPGGAASLSIFHQNSACNSQVPSNLQYSISAPFSPVLNSWHCAVGTFEDSVLKFYMDGVLMSTDTVCFKNAKNCTNTPLIIGSWWCNELLPFKGKIDDVRIYNRALNQNEISALCPQFAPLSVTLRDFNTKTIDNKKVLLEWDTEEEIDVEKYVIQRAVAGSSDFTDLGTVQALTSSSQNHYSFTDDNLLPNIPYCYRLQIIERNGKENYSSVRTASITGSNRVTATVYPNPTNSTINIYLNGLSGNTQIELFNNQGQSLFKKSHTLNGNLVSLDLKNYPPSVYWITIKNGDDRFVKKIIKK